MAGTLGVTDNAYTEQSQLELGPGPVKRTIHGSDLVRGAVLERSSNKFIVLTTPANAYGILAEDADAAAADVEALVYLSGGFRYSDLEWPTMSAADKKTALEALEDRGIYTDRDVTKVEATA